MVKSQQIFCVPVDAFDDFSNNHFGDMWLIEHVHRLLKNH